MSVIIRLQNLPWSANALEIRTFFRGLNIPDGGVHIVGGEMGDAFIAFSSDEDARQAMLLDRGKINEVQIRLLLSSRSEMQKVIEQARQHSLSLQKKILSGQTATVSLSAASPLNKNEAESKSRGRMEEKRRGRNTRERSYDNYRSSSSSSNEREYRDHRRRDRSRSTSRDRSRRSSRRSHSRDKTSDKNKDSNNSNKNVWDTIINKSQNYTNAYSTKATKPSEIDLTSSPKRDNDSIPGLDGIINQNAINNLKNLLNSNPNITSENLLTALTTLTKPSNPPTLQQCQTAMTPLSPMIVPNPLAIRPERVPSGSVNSYPAMNTAPQNLNPPQQNLSESHNQNATNKYSEEEIQDKRCIRIAHMNPKTTYSEVRRFFSGLFIQTNGIKLINDDKGDRLGTAYVKFLRATSTSKALFRDGTMMNGWKVKVDVVSESEFDVAIDSYRPPNKWHDKSREDNEHNGAAKFLDDPSNDVTVLKLLDLPNYAVEIDIKKMFGLARNLEIRLDREKTSNKQYGFVKFENSLDLKRALLSNSCPRIGNHKIDVRKSTVEEMEELCKIMDTDVLLLSDLPAFSTEQDVMKLFNNFSIIDIFMTRSKPEGKKEYEYLSYIKVSNLADARKILANRTYTLGHRIINVRVSNSSEMEDAKEAHLNRLAQEEAERKKNEEKLKNNIREEQIHIPEIIVPPQNPFNTLPIPTNAVPPLMSVVPQPMENTDPRLRNGASSAMKRKSRFNDEVAKPEFPMFPSLFIGLSNIAYRASVIDIGTYFMENNCSPNRIEIIKAGPKGLPCGDVILEMKCMEDIKQALTLNNSIFHSRKITIVPITINDVMNRASEEFLRDCQLIPMQAPPQFIPQTIPQNANNFNPLYQQQNNRRNDFESEFSENDGSNPSNFMEEMKFNSYIDQNVNDPEMVPEEQPTTGVPDKFNYPGKVLVLQNVPYSATIEDIARFFGNFDVSPEDVIRRYNKDGSPTGDARVAFRDEYLTQTAFEQKNRQKLFNRILYLSYV